CNPRTNRILYQPSQRDVRPVLPRAAQRVRLRVQNPRRTFGQSSQFDRSSFPLLMKLLDLLPFLFTHQTTWLAKKSMYKIDREMPNGYRAGVGYSILMVLRV